MISFGETNIMLENIDPKSRHIQENLPKIKKVIFDKKVSIFFVASTELKNLIAKGEHPMVKELPDVFKSILLVGDGLAIQKKMVWDWINGKLDAKNSFVLSNGEIRVLQQDMRKIITNGGI